LLSVVKIFPGKIEILISDNFSTDDTKQVCDRWLRSFDCYGPVAYTKNDSNIGVARNIISLIEQAKGNYFLFIGDDDCLFENGLRRIIEVLESDNPPSAIIQGQGWGGESLD
jgi:glycosyltransferase involved in cell wall biosynthesis